MTESLHTHLRQLTALPGLSGHEDPVIQYFSSALRELADDVQVDPLGNVIARFGPVTARCVAVLAHMDTVGLMVKSIHKDGTLGVVPVGGVNFRALPGTAVRLGYAGELRGVIGVRSQHLAQPDEEAPNADNVYVQIGRGQTVEVTTPITYAPNEIELGGKLYASPYLDNRAGCAVLLETARQLAQLAQAGREAAQTVYLVGTVQEETTCAGAYHALAKIAPDAAIFVDGTVSYDTPETEGQGMVALGGGPVLTSFLYVSGLNGWHAHPLLRKHLKQVATDETIPYQQDAVHGLISDARVVTWLGVPSALIGLPMRGKHAPLETIHLDDLDHAVRLLLATINKPLPTLTRG